MSTATIEEQATDNAQGTPAQPPAQPKKAKRPYVFTPFQAMKVLNLELEKAGLANVETGEGCVQGPMVYQYGNQGKFKVHPAQVDVDAGVEKPRQEVDEESFNAFVEEFVKARKSGKRVTSTAPATADETAVDQATNAAMEESQPVVTDDNELDDSDLEAPTAEAETAEILSDPETMDAIAEGDEGREPNASDLADAELAELEAQAADDDAEDDDYIEDEDDDDVEDDDDPELLATVETE